MATTADQELKRPRHDYHKTYYQEHKEERLAYQRKRYTEQRETLLPYFKTHHKGSTYKNYQKKYSMNLTDEQKKAKKEYAKQYRLKKKQEKLEAEKLKIILLPPPLHLLYDDLSTLPLLLFNNDDIIAPPTEFS
jgi:hypothetical protein